MNHRLIIEPTTVGQRGQHYRAWHDGAVLVKRSLFPEYDACRALLAKGIAGKISTYMGNEYAHLVLEIEKAAKWTIREDELRSPQLVRYRTRTRAANDNAVLYDAEAA